MLGGHLLSPALLVGQEFLETGSCEGEGLPAKAHQVGILKPGVTEAVLNGGTGPVREQRVRIQTGNEREIGIVYGKGSRKSLPRVATEDLFEEQGGTLGHILIELREVKLCRLDPSFRLRRIVFNERRLAAQPG